MPETNMIINISEITRQYGMWGEGGVGGGRGDVASDIALSDVIMPLSAH